MAWALATGRSMGALSLWEASLTPAARIAKDTLTYAGFLRNGLGSVTSQFHGMKLHHFLLTGRLARAHAEAVSIVHELEPLVLSSPTPPVYERYQLAMRRNLLAEAYAVLGRHADAVRENDRFAADARKFSQTGDFGGVEEGLGNAAYVDVLIGRYEEAIAKLKEIAKHPTSGLWASPAVLRADAAYAPLRGRPEFEKLVNELESRGPTMTGSQPSAGPPRALTR